MSRRLPLLVAVLVVVSSPVAVTGVTATAPKETDDGATYTISTQSIDLHPGGTICAKKVAPDVNRVTVTDATMRGVDLYLGDGDRPKHVSAPSADVDQIVLYTNGNNTLVDLLAVAGACVPTDQPQQTVLQVYYSKSDTLALNGFQMNSTTTDRVPEPGGLTVPQGVLDNSTEDGDSTSTANATGALDRTTETVQNGTDAGGTATDAADAAVGETTAVDTATQTGGHDATGTADDATKTVDDTTDTVTDATDDTTDAVTDAASETVAPEAGFDLSDGVPTVGTPVALDASPSSDSDGEIVTYEWDLDGDGTYDATGETVTHAFSAAGDRTVRLRVTDDDGATDTVEKTIGVNAPPEASFAVRSDVLEVGSPISLDASASSDSDGEIVAYEWDLDGDGTYDATGTSPTPTFSDVGEHTSRLRVTDDDGATDTVEKTIDLTDGGSLLDGSAIDTATTTDTDTTTDTGILSL
ncbi:MAG: PKD domain-containing protein [Haloarculaceae archaeon]